MKQEEVLVQMVVVEEQRMGAERAVGPRRELRKRVGKVVGPR